MLFKRKHILSMNFNTILHAQFITRNNFIIADKINNGDKSIFSDSYAFAISKSIYPTFHEDLGLEGVLKSDEDLIKINPFYFQYKTSYREVSKIDNFLDLKFKPNKNEHNYNISGNFNMKSGDYIVSTYNILRHFILFFKYNPLPYGFITRLWLGELKFSATVFYKQKNP